MNRNKLDVAVDYKSFDSPVTGLAAMILAQAAYDAKALDGRNAATVGKDCISRWELINFFRSEWADYLAGALRVDRRDLRRFERETLRG